MDFAEPMGRDVKYKIATRQLEVVDVAAPMEEGGDVKQWVATREPRAMDFAEPMDRDVKYKLATRELEVVDFVAPMEEGGDVQQRVVRREL